MAERGNGSAAAPGGAAPSEAAPAQPPEDTLDLKARLDRFGELLARGLDLAEAGLSLGLTMLGTIGSAAQTKIIERMLSPQAEEPPAAGPPAAPGVAPGAAAPGPLAAMAPGAAAATPSYGITNRLPLRPGGAVRISFSINNESAEAAKPVRLLVEAFAGERTGATLPEGALGVTPPEIAIAPMDFEKFLLEGMIPDALPPDLYRGSVVVLGEGTIRIPVLLSVEASG